MQQLFTLETAVIFKNSHLFGTKINQTLIAHIIHYDIFRGVWRQGRNRWWWLHRFFLFFWLSLFFFQQFIRLLFGNWFLFTNGFFYFRSD